MLFVIEYVDTLTGVGGEALSWEFAKSEHEAIIKARAHLLLFKARFCAQGYRILDPAGRLVARGPGVFEQVEAADLSVESLMGEAHHWGGEAGPCSSAREPLPSQSSSSPSIFREENIPDSPEPTPPPSETPADSEGASLAGKRVLVVEDDGLIALDIVSDLRRAGCTAVGPAGRLETAMTIAAAQELDAAVLDVFLEGDYAWQLAGALKAQGVPFLFHTGFGSSIDFPDEFASVPCLEKPLKASELKRELKAILERGAERRASIVLSGAC
jgi:CheY-like chemotaxis protein